MFPRVPSNSGHDLLPEVPCGSSIPKIIRQVYVSKDLPPSLRANVAKIIDLNPGWSYHLYDDADMTEYIRSIYGKRVLEYYNRINGKYGASRADLFRYLVMYKEGGVYLDIKSSLEKGLDHMLRADDAYILSRWRNDSGEKYAGWGLHKSLRSYGGELQQWHIIAVSGHPFLRAVIEDVFRAIDRYNPLLHSTGKGGVIRVTGPVVYTRAIVPLLNQHKHRIVDSEALGLIYSVYDLAGFQSHRALFSVHYTQLREPVARVTGATRLLWLIFAPMQNALRRVRHALKVR